MARTLSEIYDAIALEKANMNELSSWFTNQANPGSILDDHQTLLNDLTSSSKVAIWRLMLWVVAVAIWIHEGLWDVFKGEVDEILAANVSHNLRWYQEESLKFQFGDQLVWNSEHYQYEYTEINSDKQIIAHAATEESNGLVKVKVARLVNNELKQLDAVQEEAFTAFWAQYKDAGVMMSIVNAPADLLKLQYEIYYDATVLNADGSLINDSSVFPIEEAINSYLNELDFNASFSLEQCDAKIMKAVGVLDLKRLSAQTKHSTFSYINIDVSRKAFSGYFIIDPENPLRDNITYINHV